jgi:hypothetical protein
LDGMKDAMLDAMLAVTVARNRLDNAEGLDEVEAAIYELNAAEIRLDSVIKKVKGEADGY